ncbi:phospholipid-translocating ATPase rsb1 [Fusarium piperis]|uniref:Phospholipid-translocating ATPase rsb1 n=1 Tax=Fusarium piperis TaxID=1435070 RepID=A0A9W8WMT1_9HYPO|nr:phospholipid-translocating ATPase rsb1 [Fusarium piperis]
MFCALILEILGYASRVGLHYGKDLFLMYIVTLTIGPAFLSAALYLCLARIITVYGAHIARFRPMVYTSVFMLLDFFALLLQSAGGALVGGDDPSMWDTGLKILQAGLSIHLMGIVVYAALCFEFGVAVRRARGEWSVDFKVLQLSTKFKMFCLALGISTLAVLIRTAFRVAELSQGFDSKIAKSETAFLLLEGTMIFVSCLCLTIYHPGIAFQGRWVDADFSMKAKSRSNGEEDVGCNHVSLHSM